MQKHLNAKKYSSNSSPIFNEIEKIFLFIKFNLFLFNYTPLICASANDHVEIVRLLLAQPGIDINCRDIHKQKFCSFHSKTNFFKMKFIINDIFGILFWFFIKLHLIMQEKR